MQHLDPSQGTSRHPSLEQPFQNHGQSLFPKGTTTSCECLSNIQQLCFPFASARRDSKSGSRSGYSSPRLGSAMPCAKSHWICLWLHRGGVALLLCSKQLLGNREDSNQDPGGLGSLCRSFTQNTVQEHRSFSSLQKPQSHQVAPCSRPAFPLHFLGGILLAAKGELPDHLKNSGLEILKFLY